MRPLRFIFGVVRHALSTGRSPQPQPLASTEAGAIGSDPHASSESRHDARSPHRKLIGLGIGPDHWAFHAWLQWLPLSVDDLSALELDFSGDPVSAPSSVSIGLQMVPLERLQDSDWDAMRGMDAVYVPAPERIDALRQAGIAAHPLAAGDVPNGWLNTSDVLLQEASERLGLPPPQTLPAILEAQEISLLCLGSTGQEWDAEIPADWLTLPAFDDLVIEDCHSARLLACWLNACSRLGLQLIRLHPTLEEFYCTPYRALQRPMADAGSTWLTPPMVWGVIQPCELLEELSWLRAGSPVPEILPTPQPEAIPVWIQERDRPVHAAICVSLHNYADRILAALDSCAAQTEDALELLIIDDASEDNGVNVVRNWLDRHASRFVDARLLRHSSNSGLAAARNSAFKAARSEWCFVLDADNLLKRDAVKHCLRIAHECSDSIAVVHPLVVLRQEWHHYRQPESSLLTRISWQQQSLLHGNLIDAMALIRKSAWESVGGYTHIPGGWEDFDFWCKLIEAGYGGVLCPQKLAVYNRHQASMQATQTIRGERRLKRVMMARHPWLKLEDQIVV